MSAYALGKKAFGFCDRCGFRYPLHELKQEVINLNTTNLLVCPDCWDPDQPQNLLGRYHVDDPQALRNPRPDQGLTESRYGDSVRYDFESTVEDFTLTTVISSSSTVYGSVSHNSSSETITCTPLDDSTGRALNGVVSPTLSIDSSIYDYVRVRVKVTTDPSPSPNSSYLGKMFWRTDSAAYSQSAVSVTNPNWLQMGDSYQLLTWDLSSDTNWSGTITGVYWVFFTSLTQSGVYEIDYITFNSV